MKLNLNQIELQSITGKNKIINGNFDIWQRGTSLTVAAGDINKFVADRWASSENTSSVSVSRQAFAIGQTAVPNNPKYFHRNIVTSVASTSAFSVFAQKIEGVDTLAGKTATLSFYAKADAAKPITIEFIQDFGSGGTPSPQITSIGIATFNLTTSWQKFTTTVDLPDIAGKVLGTDGNDRIVVHFWFEAGSDYNSRTNSLGQQSGTFDLAQLQFEEGSVATDFEPRFFSEELRLCQRYYEKSYALDQVPGVAGVSGIRFWQMGTYLTVLTTNYLGLATRFRVEKRATPTVVSYDNAGNAGYCTHPGVADGQPATIMQNSTAGVGIVSAGTANYYGMMYHFTADAEL